MLIQRTKAYPKPSTVQRAWDLDQEAYPNRTEQQWAAIIREVKEGKGFRNIWGKRQGVDQNFEDENTVTDPGMETAAAFQLGQQAAWMDYRWYKQALGTSNNVASHTNRELGAELIRKSYIDSSREGRVTTVLTVFNAADFASASTTVAAAPAPTVDGCTLNSATGFATGDYVRVQTPSGYQYRTITLAGAAVTYDTPLTQAPLAGATVDQVVQEAGLFGDKPAGYTTGTIAVTNGSAVVTGTGTAWLGQVAAGDKIRLSGSRVWYTIDSVDSDTQITLTEAFAETTASDQAYFLRGSLFNRVTGLLYIKSSLRGYAYETQWTNGGT